MSVIGTRPEAIKMAPVIKELAKYPRQIESHIVATGQHREMLDQVLSIFGIQPDVDLDLMQANQGLPALTADAITSLSNTLGHHRPDLMLVQGDTTTAMAAALAAFYERIPVGHVEAGLRTDNRYSPFPEEINRRMISVLTTYHFAPTRKAGDTLLAEGVPEKNIYVTGNTVIDTLLYMVKQQPKMSREELFTLLGLGDNNLNDGEKRLILVTGHRRENFGKPLEDICSGLKRVSERNRDVVIVYPVHLNPNVRGHVYRILSRVERIYLIPPLDYPTFVQLMSQAYLILTDSGGVQEEAPSLGKPVLVMRDTTERPEAIEAGVARLIGTESESIIENVEQLLNNRNEYEKMSKAVNPFGDGNAAERIVNVLLS